MGLQPWLDLGLVSSLQADHLAGKWGKSSFGADGDHRLADFTIVDSHEEHCNSDKTYDYKVQIGFEKYCSQFYLSEKLHDGPGLVPCVADIKRWIVWLWILMDLSGGFWLPGLDC